MLTNPSGTEPPNYTPKKESKTVLFPTVELFQLARNSDITKILRLLDTGKMCPITDIYKAYSEINVQWASVGSPVKMATWHWHGTER